MKQPRTMDELLTQLTRKVALLERRMSRQGGGGGGGGSDAGVPAGTVLPWAGDVLPANALWADGQAVSRTGFATLFAAIGATFGPGDGVSTFNVPDMRGRVPVGLDPSQPEFDALGEAGGAKTHTLTEAEMPSHTHIQNQHRHGGAAGNQTILQSGVGGPGANVTTGGGGYQANYTGYATATNQSAGGGGAHNNLQPYRVLRYIITTAQVDLPGDSMLATRVGSLEAATLDTGWVDLNPYLVSGADPASDVKGRRLGDTVEIMGQVTGLTIANATVGNFLEGLPEEWRPRYRNRWGSLYAAGYPNACLVRADGTGAFVNRSGITISSGWQFSIVYMVGY